MRAIPEQNKKTPTSAVLAPSPTLGQRVNRSWATWAASITLAIVSVIIFNGYAPEDPRRWLVVALLAVLMVVQRVQAVERWGEQGAFAQLAALLVLWLAAAWLGADPSGVIIIGFVLSAHAVFALPGAKGFVWVALFSLALTIYLILLFDDLWPGLLTAAGSVAGYFFIGTAAHAQMRAEAASAESRRLLSELQSAHARLQAYADHAEALAISQERNRMARELHDTLGHRLTVAAVQLEAAQKLVTRDPQKAERMVETVRSQVTEGLGDLRATVSMLRTQPEATGSLPAVLTLLTSEFQAATGIATHVELPPVLGPLNEEQRHALVRATQEALTNVHRHARASTVWLRLSEHHSPAPEVRLVIEDDGIGPAALPAATDGKSGGYGLRGLRERAEALHGICTLSARPGGGTVLTVALPLV